MLCAETCLHLGDILRLSSWIGLPIHDRLAGVILVWSALVARRNWSTGRPYLAASSNAGFLAIIGILLLVSACDFFDRVKADCAPECAQPRSNAGSTRPQ
jgi:hypothetical protein